MRRGLLSTLGVLVLGASASVAVTAKSKPSDRDDDYVRRILDGYAKCLVQSDRGEVQSILLADPNSGEFERWRKQLRGECMLVSREGAYVNPDNVTLRFALADRMIKDRQAILALPDVAAIPALLQPAESARPGGGTKNMPGFDPRFAMLARLGECIVRANPTGAADLLQSNADSDRETASIQSILQSAATCTGGRRLQIDTLSFRGAIAFNYFRMAKMMPVTSPTGARK